MGKRVLNPPSTHIHNFCRQDLLFWQVCTNGAISLDKAYKAYTPKGFPLTSNDRAPLICPFWADTDIRQGGNVYSRITRDQTLLERASLEGIDRPTCHIMRHFLRLLYIDIMSMLCFCVMWRHMHIQCKPLNSDTWGQWKFVVIKNEF